MEPTTGYHGVFQVDAGIRNVQISGLTVEAASSYDPIANDSGYLNVAGCTLSGYDGIYFDTTEGGSLTVSNSNLSGNADRGIYFDGYGGAASVPVSITGCSISNNSGTGLYTYDEATNLVMSVQGCTICGNSSTGIMNAGTLTVSDSTISGNGDGGLVNFDLAGTATLVNCTVWDNSGGGISGGDGRSLTLDNCTVSQNHSSGSGGGIYSGAGGILGGTVTLNNSIVAYNSSSSGPDVDGLVTANYCLIGDPSQATFTSTATDQIGTHATPLNPQIANLGAYGGPTMPDGTTMETAPPLVGSPAVDAGSNGLIPSGITTDQRGLPRIVNNIVDIGACEYQLTASKLVFTSTAQKFTAGMASGAIAVQLEDGSGIVVVAGGAGQTVSLATTTSATGTFWDTADTGTITTVTIPAGSSTASFKYEDTAAGTPTLTASATGLTPATQQETVNAPPNEFSQMIVFGDSLSDVGNVNGSLAWWAGFKQTDGRFTSGPCVWEEELAKDLGIGVPTPASSGGSDYATGGAETGGGNEVGAFGLSMLASMASLNGSWGLPNVGKQVSDYFANTSVCPSNALYVIWAGGNDLIDAANWAQTELGFGIQPDVQHFEAVANDAVNNLEGYIEQLIAQGAKYIIWPNLPELDEIPHALGCPANSFWDAGYSPSVESALKDAVQTFNSDWASAVSLLQTTCIAPGGYANAVWGLDVHSLFEQMLNGRYPGLNNQFIFEDSEGVPQEASHVDPAPASADAYLFWDGMHPTELVHQCLGDAAYDLIECPNDDFASASVITGYSATVSGDNDSATLEPGEPTSCNGRGVGQSVWWQWTAPASGSVQIDTLGSDFETALSVYTGSSVSALTPVAANYDFTDPGTAAQSQCSEVTFNAVQGTTYDISVDGTLYTSLVDGTS